MKQLNLLFCLAFVISASACDKSSKVSSHAERAMNDIRNKAAELIDDPNKSLDEIQKLTQIEYNVTSIPKGAPALEIASLLNSLGKERWDCFSVRETISVSGTTELQIICKRPVGTPLRYLAPGGLGT